MAIYIEDRPTQLVQNRPGNHRDTVVRTIVLWGQEAMTVRVRCAVYTRKSSEEGLEQSFNSLDAQREACEAYILSQRHEGWHVVSTRYDDGGFSGGNMERPGLKKLWTILPRSESTPSSFIKL